MILNLSLIPVLFTLCISYVLIPLYIQVHSVVSAQTCCDMFRHECATFRHCECQLWTVQRW